MSSKKERRALRHRKNQEKDKTYKKEAWEKGALIEENHNEGPYSPEYTMELAQRLHKYLKQEYNNGTFLTGFYKYKRKIQDLIIMWNPEVPENDIYESLKTLLELYWDKKDIREWISDTQS